MDQNEKYRIKLNENEGIPREDLHAYLLRLFYSTADGEFRDQHDPGGRFPGEYYAGIS